MKEYYVTISQEFKIFADPGIDVPALIRDKVARSCTMSGEGWKVEPREPTIGGIVSNGTAEEAVDDILDEIEEKQLEIF